MINELDNIRSGAMYYIGTDSDANIISIAAGGNIPYFASWDKTGYKEFTTFNFDEFEPISRETFMELVKARDPIALV
jgi:hypothetical protein